MTTKYMVPVPTGIHDMYHVVSVNLWFRLLAAGMLMMVLGGCAGEREYAGEMVSISGGTFRMGDLSGDGFSWEKPVHRVSIPAFKLGKYEVTFAQGRMLAWQTGDAAVIPRMMKVGAGAAGRLSTFPGTMCSYSWLG